MNQDTQAPSPRRIAKLIYLHGSRRFGFRVVGNGYDGMLDLDVPSPRVGHAIVRALRSTASERPDLFPPSRR